MISFLIRLVVNTVALMITIALVPGLHLQVLNGAPRLGFIVFLIIGLLVTLINVLIRPIVLVLTGRWLIRTMGLLTLIINGLLFYLLALIVPVIMTADSIIAVIFAGLVMSLTNTFLEAILGLDSPILNEKTKSRFYWRWLAKLPPARRERIDQSLRLQHAYNTIRRYGLAVTVDRSPFRGIRRFMQPIIYPGQQVFAGENPEVAVRLMLEELGPTYVKFGQMAASRSDFLPDEWIAELEKLQNEASPFSYEEVDKIIRRELGAAPEEYFADFDRQPLAAASMAQIHRATLLSGGEVAVKVQRPDIDVTVRGDIAVMREVVSTLEKRALWAKEMGLSSMLEEFAQNIFTELDFRNEAYHARLLAHNMRDVPEVRVPAVYEAHSTATVLTMEFMKGIKITEIARREDVALDQTELARAFLRSMNRQVMLDGFFHADPHPGNVLVDPDNGIIIFLDLGMMGMLNKIQRSALIDMMYSLQEHDSQSVTRVILRITKPSREIDRRAFEKDVDRMVKRHLVFTDKNPQLSDVTQEAFILMARHGLRLQTEYTMALKSLVQTEETVRILAPELSLFDAAIEEIQQVVVEQVNPDFIVDQAKKQMARSAKDVILRLPTWQQSATKWLEQLESGRLTIHVDADDVIEPLENVQSNLDRNIRRLILALLLVGLLLSLAIASNAPALSFLPDSVAQFSLIPLTVVAIFTILYMIKLLWQTWRSR